MRPGHRMEGRHRLCRKTSSLNSSGLRSGWARHVSADLDSNATTEGILYLHLGDKEKARAALEQARIVAERLVHDAPDDPGRHAQLGAALAGLDRKEDAISEGKKAVELLPESQDAFDGPQVTTALAEIYAWVGEHDEAFRLLDHLLTVPGGLTVPTLKVDPVWDPLRNDPRFQKLAAQAPSQNLK